ncbi:MAG: DNA/RNA non-specific endonuclease [Bacteroidota bacterium]|nr:DNA/RNA non-specific endonuclease [Bacteroidota bacterium]
MMIYKKIPYLVLTIIILTIGCKSKEILPAYPELPEAGSNEIISHAAYTLSYSENHEQAEWVAYELTSNEAVSDLFDRTDDFREDPLVSTGSAALSDYSGSGFDRGHLCPAGDNKWSEEAMSESFFMSNMSPQEPQFNRQRWRYLEAQVRAWAEEFDGLYVVTAGVLKGDLNTIGDNQVAIPEYYYKVIIDREVSKGIAFLMPNINLNDQSFRDYAVTIDSIETVTEINFFPWLTKSEDKIETKIDTALWGFSYY